MSLGLCCQYMVGRTKRDGSIVFENAMEERTLQFGQFKSGKYYKEYITNIYINNLKNLFSMLKRISLEGFRSFRMSSNILPLFDVIDPSILENELILSLLKSIGELVLSKNIRLTCHPNQFCVISSKNEDVIKNSFKILNYHSWVFDAMGLPRTPYYAINIHGGARGQSSELIKSILALNDNVRSRLTLENDERSYNVKDLQDVFKETGVPICFDFHHHTFNDAGLSSEDAFETTKATWNKDVQPLVHLSNTEPEFMKEGSFTDKRKHSYYIHYINDKLISLINNDEVACDVEAKGKNLAILKMIKDFGLKL